MSRIDIQAFHDLSREDAQHAVDRLAGDLAEKFDVDYGWDGDTLVFERPGVYGEITVEHGVIRVKGELGLLLAVLRSRFEDEIRRYLSEHLACRFTHG